MTQSWLTGSPPHPSLCVFSSHDGDTQLEEQGRIFRGHSFFLEHALSRPCYRPISEQVLAKGWALFHQHLPLFTFPQLVCTLQKLVGTTQL